jgi:hypothetical protein
MSKYCPYMSNCLKDKCQLWRVDRFCILTDKDVKWLIVGWCGLSLKPTDYEISNGLCHIYNGTPGKVQPVSASEPKREPPLNMAEAGVILQDTPAPVEQLYICDKAGECEGDWKGNCTDPVHKTRHERRGSCPQPCLTGGSAGCIPYIPEAKP